MPGLNKKGFTLVELLAVIVVLAIIMLIAMPSVLGTLNDAQKGTFKVFAQKVLNKAQEKYQADTMLGTYPALINSSYCYPINSSIKDPTEDESLGMPSSGNYKGYVIVIIDEHLVPTFYLTLTDNNFSVTHVEYAALENPDGYDAPSKSITSTCPTNNRPT